MDITRFISETFYWLGREKNSFITFNLIKTESQHSPPPQNFNFKLEYSIIYQHNLTSASYCDIFVQA